MSDASTNDASKYIGSSCSHNEPVIIDNKDATEEIRKLKEENEALKALVSAAAKPKKGAAKPKKEICNWSFVPKGKYIIENDGKEIESIYEVADGSFKIVMMNNEKSAASYFATHAELLALKEALAPAPGAAVPLSLSKTTDKITLRPRVVSSESEST